MHVTKPRTFLDSQPLDLCSLFIYSFIPCYVFLCILLLRVWCIFDGRSVKSVKCSNFWKEMMIVFEKLNFQNVGLNLKNVLIDALRYQNQYNFNGTIDFDASSIIKDQIDQKLSINKCSFFQKAMKFFLNQTFKTLRQICKTSSQVL